MTTDQAVGVTKQHIKGRTCSTHDGGRCTICPSDARTHPRQHSEKEIFVDWRRDCDLGNTAPARLTCRHRDVELNRGMPPSCRMIIVMMMIIIISRPILSVDAIVIGRTSVCLSVRPSVRDNRELWPNGWMDRADFWHRPSSPQPPSCIR